MAQTERTITKKAPRPMDQIKNIEARRIELGLKKYEICEKAGIKPEMLSYLLRRGQKGFELPQDCLEKVMNALTELEAK